MQDILILGAGSQSPDVVWLIEQINERGGQWRIVGLIDDAEEKQGVLIGGRPVIGTTAHLNDKAVHGCYVTCSVGNPTLRKHLLDKALSAGLRPATLIHPSAIVSRHAVIEEGVVITHYCVVASEAAVRFGAYLNLACTVGHNAVIGEYVSCLPGARISGSVKLGAGVEIGSGAVLMQGIEIGEWTTIGAGSIVFKSVPERVSAIGNPARVIMAHK